MSDAIWFFIFRVFAGWIFCCVLLAFFHQGVAPGEPNVKGKVSKYALLGGFVAAVILSLAAQG